MVIPSGNKQQKQDRLFASDTVDDADDRSDGLTDEERRLIGDLVGLLVKAVKVIRYYPHGNPLLTEAYRELLAKFQSYFTRDPLLVLEITETAFWWMLPSFTRVPMLKQASHFVFSTTVCASSASRRVSKHGKCRR